MSDNILKTIDLHYATSEDKNIVTKLFSVGDTALKTPPPDYQRIPQPIYTAYSESGYKSINAYAEKNNTYGTLFLKLIDDLLREGDSDIVDQLNKLLIMAKFKGNYNQDLLNKITILKQEYETNLKRVEEYNKKVPELIKEHNRQKEIYNTTRTTELIGAWKTFVDKILSYTIVTMPEILLTALPAIVTVQGSKTNRKDYTFLMQNINWTRVKNWDVDKIQKFKEVYNQHAIRNDNKAIIKRT